jgi:hypothetical protein
MTAMLKINEQSVVKRKTMLTLAPSDDNNRGLSDLQPMIQAI